jgi:cytochrome c peroxidase
MRHLFLTLGVIAMLGISVAVFLNRGTDYEWQLPADLPIPKVPFDNPMSDTKVELGRRLFYDTRLSANGTMSCGSCHIQALAFTDGRARSVGVTGDVHPRGSMSLVNSAYASRLTWANPLLDRAEDQALTPLLGDNPIEMGLGGKEDMVPDLLRADPVYKSLFPSVFRDDRDPYSLLNVVRAISAFTRTIISADSPYDRYLAGNEAALSDAATRGMELFFSERLECFHCHGGFNFTDSTTHANASVQEFGYHNTGLYNLQDDGSYPADNTGLYDMTGQRRDMGRFKAPSLRNIAITAPYMHDGSIGSLREVLAHYERGGRLIEDGPYAGDGRLNPFKSEFINGFELTDTERDDLVAFLESLTDPSVLNDPRFSNPFAY